MPLASREFGAFIRDENARWKKVVEVSGFKIED